jgi:AraC-like DNA-binding protein
MPRSAIFTFTDPIPYQAAIRAADVQLLIAAKGHFRAELTQIDLDRLWMQQGRENLPRVFHAALSSGRAPIGFLARANQAAVHHCGIEVSPGDIIVNGSGSTFHRRTSGPCRWASMSLTPEHLAAAGNAILGRDVAAPSVAHVLRPAPPLMARLLALHEEAIRLAKIAPEKLAHPEVTRALEQALVHAMITCLADGTRPYAGSRWRHHSAIIKRFEELLAANCDRPMYLAEICAATGASERTLRVCCEEHLGMGPIRYLWLRRMHLARRALILADPAKATVTQIATEHGFWELGRFAVSYRALFGESPSASLGRPSNDRRIFHDRPSALADSESA